MRTRNHGNGYLFVVVLRFTLMLTNEPPKVNANGRYTVMQTANALGIDRKTLLKYTNSLAIRCAIRKATGRKFYYGKEIIRFWTQSF